MEVGAEGRGFFFFFLGGLQAPFVYKCGRVLWVPGWRGVEEEEEEVLLFPSAR